MGFCINKLLDKLLEKIKLFNPQWCRELDDPRIDTYYISINPYYYVVLSGYCGECDNIYIYNNTNLEYDIMTPQGINKCVNGYGININKDENIIFELNLNTFNGNMNELILFLANSIENIIPFEIPILK